MARLPRLVVPDHPHHVTQRGNRRQAVFTQDDDYALYRDLMAQSCERNGVEVWCYCLMPNHVHLVLTPSTEDGLSRAVGEAHRRFSGYINARMRVTGHVFQGRFNSRVMDEEHLLAAARYIALNPVKAKLVDKAQDWRWSSAPAHLAGRDDDLVRVQPLANRVTSFAEFLATTERPDMIKRIESDQSIGRPLMHDDNAQVLEQQLGVRLRPRKRGRPAAREQDSDDRQLPTGAVKRSGD